MQPAFAGIDVAFAKEKRLPVVVCTWQGDRLIPAALRRLPFQPPAGSGNARSCDPAVVEAFAAETVAYLRKVENHLNVKIKRIGIDAPSAPCGAATSRRLAEAALDRAGISCFTTPSDADFVSIRKKVAQHLGAGGLENRLPHANQLWMQVGFALFQGLENIAECIEVYPQATVRVLGAGEVHKFKKGAVDAQLAAVSAITGWPINQPGEPAFGEIAWAPLHDFASTREFHRGDWPKVGLSIAIPIESFDHYFERVVSETKKLKALWVE